MPAGLSERIAMAVTLAAVGAARITPADAQPAPANRQQSRVAVFRAAGFPTAEATEVAGAVLDRATAGLFVGVCDSPRVLADELALGKTSVLVLPYGSAFPVDAWPAIK